MVDLNASADIITMFMDSVWFYLVIGLLAGVALGLAFKKPREKEEKIKAKQEVEKPGRPDYFLEEVISVDKALAARFYRDLRKAIRENKVRVSLTSELCSKGRVAYDFAVGKWVCIEKDGTTYPLGEKPNGETVIEEEDVGAIFKALEAESDA